jgi:hypothetical protein
VDAFRCENDYTGRAAPSLVFYCAGKVKFFGIVPQVALEGFLNKDVTLRLRWDNKPARTDVFSAEKFLIPGESLSILRFLELTCLGLLSTS